MRTVYSVCPNCSVETEVKCLDSKYIICKNCKQVYNITLPAMIQGIELGKAVQREVLEKVNKDISKTISNIDIYSYINKKG